MDYRMIINEVRAALEEKAARELYGGNLTLIQELEGEALTGLNAVEKIVDGMARQERLWLAHGMNEAVADPNTPIPGTFSRARWAAIKEMFDSFKTWVRTPLPGCGVSPVTIMTWRGNPPEPVQE